MAAPRAAIFGCAGPVLSTAERTFLRDADPWGFILFGRNVVDPAQLAVLVASLRDSVGRTAPVLIDQEGGRVARLRGPHWRDWGDAGAMVAALPDDAAAEALFLRYRLIAAELADLGIDVNCAPVLDVLQPGADPVIGERAYGATPGRVARLGRAVCDGLAAGGVSPVIKHIPGHGRAGCDSHKALPVVDAPRADLEACDFAPFRALSDAPMAMTAHVVYAALDPAHCATLSATVIDLIRNDLGFRGLLMTDDLSMGALSGDMAARAQAALAAGCDVVLHCNGDAAEMAAVAEAAPRLDGAALARAEAALHRPSAQPFDAGAALARLAALTGGTGAHA